jgi:hypothetical protein
LNLAFYGLIRAFCAKVAGKFLKFDFNEQSIFRAKEGLLAGRFLNLAFNGELSSKNSI